jgi:glycosyltransferase involved in cell wall biosynthesis
MRVALVHDPLYKLGGAELVLDALHELYPHAPVYTPIHDPVNTQGRYEHWDIRTSFLQKIPGRLRLINFLRVLMPFSIEQWDLTEYDLVISSVTSVAKGVITRQDALHVAYFHNVTRFAWMDLEEHISGAGFAFTAWPARIALSRFRQWDFLAADRPDYIIANSRNVAARIAKYYRREAHAVIFPPVNIGQYRISSRVGNFYLIVSRLEPHKRIDLAIDAFNELGLPLKIVGDGPQKVFLQKKARANIEFLGRISEQEKVRLMSNCLALLYPQEEDFGITAIEAQACGRPVIAYAKGGVLETVIPRVTGELFAEQTVASLKETIAGFKPERYNINRIRAHAERFDQKNFYRDFADFVQQKLKEHGT